jgi:hypothetical protein
VILEFPPYLIAIFPLFLAILTVIAVLFISSCATLYILPYWSLSEMEAKSA